MLRWWHPVKGIRLENAATIATFITMKVGIREAKNHLSKFGDLAHAGETITICKHGRPWFDLKPHDKGEHCLEPLFDSRPTITAEEATAPAHPDDLQGWT